MASETLSIRLTAAERQTLTARAKRDGRPLSQWVRLAALGAAGGVSSEWTPDGSPAWARSVARLLVREVKASLRRTPKR